MRIFNSYDSEHKKPFGAIRTGEEVFFRLKFEKSLQISDVSLLLCEWEHWEENFAFRFNIEYETETYVSYTCKIKIAAPNVYGYCFQICLNNRYHLVKQNYSTNDAFISENKEGRHWLLTCYPASFETPEFLKNGVMYQIFPDRFFRAEHHKEEIPGTILNNQWGELPVFMPNDDRKVLNNDFFGGDFKGIIKKLPYLKKLGVTVLYLMPICESMENHGYSTANYRNVNPYLGSIDDFKNLVSRAHEYGMHVIIDAVFSHTGSDSIYFNKNRRYPTLGAYNSPDSPFYKWYTFSQYPREYKSWWGHKTLPELNKWNKNYQNFIFGEHGLIDFWFSLGIDGLRLDVADELPDEFLSPLSQKVKSFENKALIGEVWENAITKKGFGKRRIYLLGSQLDSVMNYPFRDAILKYVRYENDSSIPEANFFNSVVRILESYPTPVLQCLMNFLGTHDTVRALTQLAGEELYPFEDFVEERIWEANHDKLSEAQYRLAKDRLVIASILQFFLPGIPCIYYGDEVGMHGYKDPFNRKCFPWQGIDFSLLKTFRALGRIRNKYAEFLKVAKTTFPLIDENICILERYTQDSKMVFIINRSGKEQVIFPFDLSKFSTVFNRRRTTIDKANNKLVLNPYGAVIFESKL